MTSLYLPEKCEQHIVDILEVKENQNLPTDTLPSKPGKLNEHFDAEIP